MRSRATARYTIAGIALAICLGGCGATTRDQLQQVAKDWCETIRASQVIPVYPLTEDLQPGDIFLVQIPIDRQQELYEQKGFLALDNHVGRLDPSGYRAFYGRAFDAGFGDRELPRFLQRPSAGTAAWATAPSSAFPTYSFSVRRGGGLNLAIPVQGVPVGLSLMAADGADGSVSLKDARTLGVDTVSLYQQVRDWASANREFVRHFGATPATNYLRILNRVYLTGKVDVSLRAAAEGGAGLDAGKTSPAGQLTAAPPAEGTTASAAKRYNDGLAQINQAISGIVGAAGSAVGGSLRVTAASARAISLEETFDPPLVFGYMGFDVPILSGGELGAPIPTHSVLEPGIKLPAGVESESFALYKTAVTRRVYDALSSLKNPPAGAKEAVAALDALSMLVPAQQIFYREIDRGRALKRDQWSPADDVVGYERYQAWRGKLSGSVKVLDHFLGTAKISLSDVGEVVPGTEEWNGLALARDEFRGRIEAVDANPAVRDATRSAWNVFNQLMNEEE